MRGVALGVSLLVLALASAALDADSGVRPWLHLRAELADAHARIASLREETGRLGEEIARLEAGDFALERAIREELERVRPGQVLVRLQRSGTAAPIP